MPGEYTTFMSGNVGFYDFPITSCSGIADPNFAKALYLDSESGEKVCFVTVDAIAANAGLLTEGFGMLFFLTY